MTSVPTTACVTQFAAYPSMTVMAPRGWSTLCILCPSNCPLAQNESVPAPKHRTETMGRLNKPDGSTCTESFAAGVAYTFTTDISTKSSRGVAPTS